MRPVRRVFTALLGTVAAAGLALAGTPAQAAPVNSRPLR